LITKGRLEALRTFLEREGEALGVVNATVPEWTGDKRASLLQGCCSEWAMLEELRTDPTIAVGGEDYV
jgi:hypothetical protein